MREDLKTYIGGGKSESNELGMQSSNQTTLCGGSNFGVVDRDGDVHHTNSKASNDTSSDEHANVNGSSLDDSGDHSNSSCDRDCLLTAKIIRAPCCKEDAKYSAGIESTNNSALDAGSEWVEVDFEVLLGDDC